MPTAELPPPPPVPPLPPAPDEALVTAVASAFAFASVLVDELTVSRSPVEIVSPSAIVARASAFAILTPIAAATLTLPFDVDAVGYAVEPELDELLWLATVSPKPRLLPTFWSTPLDGELLLLLPPLALAFAVVLLAAA